MAEDEPEKAAPHRLAARVAIAVGLIAFVAFLPSLIDGFVYDDGPLITGNEYVHALKWVPRAFVTHLWDVSPLAVAGDLNGAVETSRRYYRPLITLSHLFTWVVAGHTAWPYHLTNIVAHALTAWLATRAAIRWTGSLRLGGAIGLIFALHPTRTENVLWISGRMDIFMLLFGLVAVEGFRRFDRARRPTTLALGAVALVAALLCKEPAVMLPFVLLAERLPGVPSDRRGSSEKPAPSLGRAPLVIMAAICGGYALLRIFLLPPEGDTQRSFTPVAFVFTVGEYAKRALAPWPPVMFYDQVPYASPGHPLYGWPMLAFGGVLIVATVAALVVAWCRDRVAFWLLVSAAAFLGPLLNVYFNGLKDTAQDRFLYAPLLFAIAAVVRLARARLQRVFRQRTAWLALAGLALVAVGIIELRTLDFRNDDTFWAAELVASEDDPYVLRMNGSRAATRADLPTALSFFRRAAAPEAFRYESTTLWVTAHFAESAMLASTLADGDIDELRALEGELYRTVDATKVPPRSVVSGVPIGAPLPPVTMKRMQDFGSYRWDAALLATRTGDFALANDIVEHTHASRTAANPLNGVLVLARIGRSNDARALLDELRRMTSFQDQSGAQDYEGISRRLGRADAMARLRDEAKTADEKHAYEALRLAELGVYWSAFRVVVDGKLQDHAETQMLALQLLVACRLDAAASAFAGDDAVVAKMFGDLPPAVRAMQPVMIPLDQVLALAARPL